MSAANVAIRLARREVTRRPFRSLVVMLLVLVPVVILTGLAVMVRTNDRTPDERFTAVWGQADVVVWGDQQIDADTVDVQPDTAALQPLFDVGGRALTMRDTSARLRTTDGLREYAHISDAPVGDPMLAGLIDGLEGRLPTAPDEVLISPPLAEKFELGLGDTLELERPSEHTATVVGLARWRDQLKRPFMLVANLDSADSMAATFGADVPREGWETTTLIDLPPGAERTPGVAQLLAAGEVQNRFVPMWHEVGGDAQLTIVWSWVGGAVAFVIVGVVIAAAFAVTARRQLRLIGQLMGNGASERTLRATLFLQGTVIGLLGGIVGVALALGSLVAFEPLVEQIIGRRLTGYDVVFADLVPIVILATLAATGAALIPARTAVRTSVLQALAGRRPVGPYPNKLVARGALAVVAGLILLAVSTAGAQASGNGSGGDTWLFVLTGIAGAVALILGTCAMSPAIISRLEPLAGHLRGSARLAARSVARQRTRTGAVVAAVAVVAAAAVMASTVWLTSEHSDNANAYRPLPDNAVRVDFREDRAPADPNDPAGYTSEPLPIPTDVIDQLVEVVPGAQVIHQTEAAIPEVSPELREAATDAGGSYRANLSGSVSVVDDELARALDLEPEVRAALADTGIVTSGWDPTTGENTLDMGTDDVALFDRHGYIVDVVEGTIVPLRLLPLGQSAVAEWKAVELGLSVGPGATILAAPERLTDLQLDRISDVADEAYDEHSIVARGSGEGEGEVSRYLWVEREYRSWEPSNALITAGILGVATIFSLGVVALGLALSAAETKDERDVLAAIGAPPRTLRRLAASKAAVLAVVGTVVGVPLGFVPTWVVVRASDSGYDSMAVVFPWLQVGLLVVVVPLVATAATLLASGIALHTRPVQASSMAFD
ncbi:MAG: FtsX-like permease family protein [Acidimicrobiia bacterium]|nr:FtsX-like permease family protein [Acidimicrobiia bacterium]